ncbi:hypothetical protein DM47_1609 [Burkholderia mallei]|nr:hypothetical protein DM75_1756 [Burkholderia mallei]KGD31066.1 hypothetical protein DP59_5540 [Burkholderia pseudomallei]KGD57759.1 hypothetical protein DP49_4625 [Burkholderia pseudomallei]KOS70384.1 hypothetical protein DM46_1231 [Burkholderia mallei]KOT01529.1 hypothetical protein DM50_2236 [Burkholderia mallei]
MKPLRGGREIRAGRRPIKGIELLERRSSHDYSLLSNDFV